MAPSNESLVHFLNHGLLPFVGREIEARRLQAFASSLDDGGSLKVGLVSGEAGIGKSRLLEEALARVIPAGTCVISVRLHEDTADALMPLIASSLWRSEDARTLFRTEPAPESVVASLRRLARLRRTLLIVEDIHLLRGPHVAELATLVALMRDDSIGMLFSARTLERPVRGVLEPYLRLSVELSGLTPAALGTVWTDLFGGVGLDRALIDRLLERTTGNPLALRLAIRSGIRTELDSGSADAGGGAMVFDRDQLDRSLDAHVQLFSEGMIAHLSAEERRWAAQLAALGEIVAPESARIMIVQADEAITTLRLKGIITESSSIPKPLGQTVEGRMPPMVFTHTLLHRHFLGESVFDLDKFWQVLAEDAPIYSRVPFGLITVEDALRTCRSRHFPQAILKYSVTIADALLVYQRNTVEQELLYGPFLMITEQCAPLLDDELGLTLRLYHQFAVLNIFHFRYVVDTPERQKVYPGMLSEYLALVDRPLTSQQIRFRMGGLAWSFINEAFMHDRVDDELWERIETTMREYPELRFRTAHLAFLGWIFQYLRLRVNAHPRTTPWLTDLFERASNQLDDILLLDDPECRLAVAQHICPFGMIHFRTRHEQQRCAQMYGILDSRTALRWPGPLYLLSFLARNGDIELALRHNLAINASTADDVPFSEDDQHAWLPVVLNGSGMPLADIASMMRRIRNRIDPAYREAVAYVLHHYGILRGETVAADALFCELTGAAAFEDEEFAGQLVYWFAEGTLEQNHEQARGRLLENIATGNDSGIALTRFNNGELADLALLIFDRDHAPAEQDVEAGIVTTLRNGLMEIYWSEDLIVTLILLSYGQKSGRTSMFDRLQPEIHVAVTRIIEWLLETRRIVFAPFFLKHFPEIFTARERREWQTRIGVELEEQNNRLRPDSGNSTRRLSLSVIGRIGYGDGSSDEFNGIKGKRLKQLLGLMALDAIVPRHFGRAEFQSIVTEPGTASENARNTIKVAIYQLRKMLGADSILQVDDTPRLNLDVVRVDLVELHRAIEAVDREIAVGSLRNATRHLHAAFHLLHGEVLFPSLYEPIFEGAREEIESRLRQSVIHIVRGLLRDGDHRGARAILEPALVQFEGDAELDELMLRALHEGEGKIEFARRAALARE